MNILRLLPLTMMLLSGCGASRAHISPPAEEPPAATVAVIAPPQTAPDRTVTNYPDLRSAVASILNDSIQVVAFGEIHKKEISDLVSTMQYFAREVMPLLADQGITDLVWEHLPAGESAAAEIEAFGQTQALGPFLTHWFGYNPDLPGALEVLRQARALGISLHGCHASGTGEYYANRLNIVEFLNERCLAVTQSLIEPDRRIAVYTGANHNNELPVAGQDHLSFGDELSSQFGDGYMEIDILLPELIPATQDLLHLDNWQELVPESGVNHIAFASGRQVIILSESLNQ
ncbi:MAG: hypothetical protein JW782_02115 [Candidatus Saganbacteria bacterium]|nr:hypothetical protein [Candidatus Saganbacteria bacterium]